MIYLAGCFGCYFGFNFVGALAYADDVVLLGPTASSMRRMLSICDTYALQYDIVFNAQKSKFVVVCASHFRSFYSLMCKCVFCIGGNQIDNVSSFSHLGHVINSRLDDSEDVLFRRNSFVSQVNNVLCFFGKLDSFVKTKLFKAYCTSMYGCELWTLADPSVEQFCIAWRKALRRILDLPHNCHSYLLPLVTDILPAFDEIIM